MTENDIKKTETDSSSRETREQEVREQAEYTPSIQPDFLREKIKQKPVNKKKLLRRTIITAVMAVVFSIVACLTFLILEPVINNWLYPEEEAQEVQFPEEAIEEEMRPEDMLTEEAVEEEMEPVIELEDEQIQELLSKVTFGLDEYEALYEDLSALAKDVGRALVTVTGVTSDVDWFNNPYESEAVASGVIVANNGRAMLILANINNIENAERIVVTFCDQAQVNARIVQKDAATGFAILSVSLLSIGEETLDIIKIASLGSSNAVNLPGTPVMALGSPMGTSGSVCYGIVTSSGTVIDQVDAAYKLLSTDIYGSRNASGILVNLNGKVIGIIDNSFNSEDRGNLISAYGISELKRIITMMSNNQPRAYMGIHGSDVPQEANTELGVPLGAYIKEIEMDSPAMTAGIQSGDVITGVGEAEITNYNELLNVLYNAAPEGTITVTLMRQGIDSFQEMTVEVTLAESK
ncbi:MAG: S1C family serine protease [Roseburia sp.]|nr:S1C family serine protease [Roseburia sp.]MCM1241931.1 S1C family serine protease [Roseburia sp.]